MIFDIDLILYQNGTNYAFSSGQINKDELIFG